MHEFSLAQQIVDITNKAVTEAGKEKVVSITLEIGQLAGVERPALISALEIFRNLTMFESTQFQYIDIPGKARCKQCSSEYELESLYTLCPQCSSFEKEILTGKEFNIRKIEAE